MSNEVLNTIKARRGIRAYKPDAVPAELLDAVLEAGTYAPTGGGHQSPVIIAVTSDKYRKEIAEMNAGVMGSAGDPYYGAPVIVLVLAGESSPHGAGRHHGYKRCSARRKVRSLHDHHGYHFRTCYTVRE